MSESFDDLIAAAVGDFRQVEAGVKPAFAPTGAIEAAVRRRHRVRAYAFSVVAVLLVLAPIAAFGRGPFGRAEPTATPTPTASTTPSASPSPARDGRISQAELESEPFDVPPWATAGVSCPTGTVNLAYAGNEQLTVQEVIHANLDADSADETAAILRCAEPATPITQLVALDRGGDGRIITLGLILPSSRRFFGVQARVGGGITAQVCISACEQGSTRSTYEAQDYVWDGQRFAQLGGDGESPTAQPGTPKSTQATPTTPAGPLFDFNLRVSIDPVSMGPESDGKRVGSVHVVFTNDGPTWTPIFDIGLSDGGSCAITVTSADPKLSYQGPCAHYRHPAMAGGTSSSLTFTIEIAAADVGKVAFIQAEHLSFGYDSDHSDDYDRASVTWG